MNLTPVINSVYAKRAVDVSTVELNPRNQKGRHQATCSSWLLCVWNPPLWRFWALTGFHAASFLAGFTWKFVVRSELPPIISLNPIDGSSFKKENVMIKPLFSVSDSVTPTDLSDQIRYLCFQSLSVHAALTELSSNRRELSDGDAFEQLGWMLWAQGSLLEQQRLLCERLEEVGLSVPAGGGV